MVQSFNPSMSFKENLEGHVEPFRNQALEKIYNVDILQH